MQSRVGLPVDLLDRLVCPVCKSPVTQGSDELTCTSGACGVHFPVIDGIPILINQASSLFPLELYRKRAPIFFASRAKWRHRLLSWLPDIGNNIVSAQNYETLAHLLEQQTSRPRILVVGGGILGQGMHRLLAHNVELIESDVSLADRTQIVLDSHDLPFEDQTFDGVIAQAVLEHVADPHRCVEEMHRVLKSDGLVYVEIPFMQQVHGGRYDFTRFTHLGTRRLLRRFEEINSGACGGPGMALAWAILYFLLSFTTSRPTRSMIRLLTRLTLFWIKYWDYWLLRTPAALDAASGYYFLGRKASTVLSDQELVASYQGAG
jgi:SAM-dependent methyltransferase/uncharacterized protein YbaR (Trm112 family)